MHATVTSLLESYGYAFLFMFVAIESMGIPLPGETALVTAAAYAALGHLNIYGVVITAATAAILGDTGGVLWAALFGTVGYLFGRNLPQLEHYIGQASLTVVLLIALIVALVLGIRWFRAHADGIAERASAVWQRVLHAQALEKFRNHHPRLWDFIAARFARGEYLGLHLTVGLIVSVVALWIFADITEDVVHHDPLTQLDAVILHWFRSHATATGDRVMSAVSLIGSPGAMALLAVVVGVILVARRCWLLLGAWSATFVGGGVLDAVLKYVIHRPRPAGAEVLLQRFSYSFPSGHAMGSVFGYGMLAYLLVTFRATRASTRVAIVSATIVLVLAIGFSRMYLGVHYFSDVIAGYAAGVVWLAACVSGVDVARRQPQPAAH